ncbi:MAG: ATP-binding protein, partial [Candidatus Latescibacteria bacterium]|nr:ATP-binding protein [Candidatus Latescibacterota bacterium]
DLELLEQKIYSYIWKAIVILCVGILIALILSLLLQRMISRPVVHLVETTKEVSETGDYMQRVTKESNDELGVLCDEFNAMLQLIQEREDKLREARDTLEKRVELRTQELSEMNTELIVARDQALESSHAKSDFLATMSHEIRTPMNGILGMAELLIGTKLDHTQQSFLNIIDSSAKELLEILNDILDLSKIEAGKMALEIIDFSLKDCLNGIIRMMAVRAQEKGLELACHISPDVQDGLSGDPTRLRQIIVNLLSNALKFTKEGEIVLRVKQTSQIEETVSLQFDVSDTGIGISSEMEKKIFEAFTQADSSTARQFGGTGLGLTISSQLVQMMDGRIWVDSEIGKGSIFSFIAKFGILETEKKESQTVGVDSETDISTGSDARLDVLVVEDNRVNQRVATLMLNKLGHSVSVANNGIEALECIEAGGYDLIFMDMQMPVMDGLETTIKVREREQKTGKHIPIVAMTANAMQGDRERCLEAGMDDYVSKPIHRDVVIEAIKRVGDRFWKGGDETES